MLSFLAALPLVLVSWLRENGRPLAFLGIGVALLFGFLAVGGAIGRLHQAVWALNRNLKEQQKELDEINAKVGDVRANVTEQLNKLDDVDERLQELQTSVADLAAALIQMERKRSIR
jgi:septal ring factor EnvC (AmiA/AmiB activator)